MAVVDVQNQRGENVSKVELADGIFNVEVKPDLLHEVVRMQLANRRCASASVKRRSDVSGSQAKLFRQKGTGRARRGNIKSPLLRGGGVTFGPGENNYKLKVPKKKRKAALKMALSSKLSDNTLIVLDKIELDQIKTKKFQEVTESLKVTKALFVIDEADKTLELSARNLPGIKVLKREGLNVYDILKYQNLVIMESSIKGIEGRLLS
jgi:large subunit ribosomal protein L4